MDSHFANLYIVLPDVDCFVLAFKSLPNLIYFIFDLLRQGVFEVLLSLICADFFATDNFDPFPINVIH